MKLARSFVQIAFILAAFLQLSVASANGNRGLLASPGFAGQPMKGVYFFPGEYRNAHLSTAHPMLAEDMHWLSQPALRGRVIDGMVNANANVIVLSYWSNMPQWSPMDPGPTPVLDVVLAAAGKKILIMPAIESGSDPKNPSTPHFEFAKDFPFINGDPKQVSPGLLNRIRDLLRAFRGRMDKWAMMYDRDGVPRYAIHILHVYSRNLSPAMGLDPIFADGFRQVADQIEREERIRIGFTLDVIPSQHGGFSADPARTGPALEKTNAVLAIQGFISEVFSGVIKTSPPRSGRPHDNNKDNLHRMIDWKKNAANSWIATGIPVIFDVSSGFDGRHVWFESPTFFYGDNAEYTDDRWRNAMSILKGRGARGATFNTWNGYTEGYAATATREHGWTVYEWLKNFYSADPRHCHHVPFVNKRASPNVVYGAICEAWVRLGADRGFLGAPTTPEAPTPRGRLTHFQGGTIYYSAATGAHEVHGLIRDAYFKIRADSSCLGLPITDEIPWGNKGRMNRFQGGEITWAPGQTVATVRCR